MRASIRCVASACLSLLLMGCHAHDGGAKPDGEQRRPEELAALGEREAVHMTGTEPFWNATVSHGMLSYATSDRPDAVPVRVSRFVGMGGVGFSGMMVGKPVQIAVSQASCRDGMSDRTYPFTVTLRIGEQDRSGCGWAGTVRPAMDATPRPSG